MDEKDEVQKLRSEAGLSEITFEEDIDINNADPKKKKLKDAEEAEEEDEETEEETEEDSEAEDEDEEDVETSHPQRGIPPKEFNKLRSRNRELEEDKRRMQTELDSLKAKPAINDSELEEAAKRLSPQNATPEQIKATQEGLKEILNLTWKGSKMTDAEKSQISELQEQLAEFKDKEVFDKEWSAFESTLDKQFKGTPAQNRLAKEAMDELAHAPQFADKEFDYVFWKNRDIFDEIYSAKPKKAFESRDTYIPTEENEEFDKDFDPHKANREQKIKFHDKLEKEAAAQDTWNINDQGDSYEA